MVSHVCNWFFFYVAKWPVTRVRLMDVAVCDLVRTVENALALVVRRSVQLVRYMVPYCVVYTLVVQCVVVFYNCYKKSIRVGV